MSAIKHVCRYMTEWILPTKLSHHVWGLSYLLFTCAPCCTTFVPMSHVTGTQSQHDKGVQRTLCSCTKWVCPSATLLRYLSTFSIISASCLILMGAGLPFLWHTIRNLYHVFSFFYIIPFTRTQNQKKIDWSFIQQRVNKLLSSSFYHFFLTFVRHVHWFLWLWIVKRTLCVHKKQFPVV